MNYAENFYILNESEEWEEVKEIILSDSITSIGKYQFYGFDTVTKVIVVGM